MPDLSPYPDDNRPPSALVFVIIGAFASACIVIGFGLGVVWGW
jgi:hypothetical protein